MEIFLSKYKKGAKISEIENKNHKIRENSNFSLREASTMITT